MTQLIKLQDCESMDIKEVWGLYEKYVNPGQVNIFSSFAYGNDLYSKAEGMYMTTTGGRKILDFTGGFGVLNHGHNHPRILKARMKFMESKRMEVHKLFFSPYLAALSANIANLLPGDLNKSFFPNSGAEAVEGAIKIAYKSHKWKMELLSTLNIGIPLFLRITNPEK